VNSEEIKFMSFVDLISKSIVPSVRHTADKPNLGSNDEAALSDSAGGAKYSKG
jgi:hypothetical protein